MILVISRCAHSSKTRDGSSSTWVSMAPRHRCHRHLCIQLRKLWACFFHPAIFFEIDQVVCCSHLSFPLSHYVLLRLIALDVHPAGANGLAGPWPWSRPFWYNASTYILLNPSSNVVQIQSENLDLCTSLSCRIDDALSRLWWITDRTSCSSLNSTLNLRP